MDFNIQMTALNAVTVIFIYLVFLAEKEHIGVKMHVQLHTHMFRTMLSEVLEF